MKFDNLYRRIFEADGAIPSNYEVKPAPIVAGGNTGVAGAINAAGGAEGARSLLTYVTIVDSTINELNGTNEESLQKLLKDLDVVVTPFEGIADEMWSEINRAADALAGVSTMLKAYVNLNSGNAIQGSSEIPEIPEEQPSV